MKCAMPLGLNPDADALLLGLIGVALAIFLFGVAFGIALGARR